MVTQTQAVNELYIKNQQTATTKLGALDNVLGGVGDELKNIYDNALAAGNGSYSDSERAAVASELCRAAKKSGVSRQLAGRNRTLHIFRLSINDYAIRLECKCFTLFVE